MLLSWPPEIKDLIIGVILALLVMTITLDILNGTSKARLASRFNPLNIAARSLWFLWYVIVFIWECLKANIDVAYRVAHPDLPIKPGIIKVNVDLKSDVGLVFLANSITLTPGTTTIDLDREENCLYIHWLYVREGSDKPVVVEKFEKILKRIFD